MEAKGLRIGNVISNIQGDEIIVNFHILSNIYHSNEYKLLDEFEPMLLTEEWLLRFGFIGKANDYFLKESIVLKWGETHTPEDGWLFHYGKSFAYHIKQVHQLQNLYFALTGKEMELQK